MIVLSKEILNKNFRDHFSKYSEEYESNPDFEEGVYASFINSSGEIGFCNKELYAEIEPTVYYMIFNEDLFMFTDILEDYFDDDFRFAAIVKEVKARFNKIDPNIQIKVL